MTINNSEELAKLVNETKDLMYPDDNIRITFQTTESELNDVDCMDLFLCTWKNGVVDKRFNFVGRDLNIWGHAVMADFNGRCAYGGYFCCEDWTGRDAILWGISCKEITYRTVFVTQFYLRCVKAITTTDYETVFTCLNLSDGIEYIEEKDFRYGTRSPY